MLRQKEMFSVVFLYLRVLALWLFRWCSYVSWHSETSDDSTCSQNCRENISNIMRHPVLWFCEHTAGHMPNMLNSVLNQIVHFTFWYTALNTFCLSSKTSDDTERLDSMIFLALLSLFFALDESHWFQYN